ncbi:putative baseplate assembly protein [Solihabitans fulvus]|uniref:Putative baseplate assembly protein n=1 Tax=Solihabitans fulvus TaxID=1892852 RepID=A0A5B2X620_9PSEU|nr:putative baseplate assembly protein [Solihabitans fulvus]KAA2258797.1 putative baseplate assembly protein [Solihabitans fulvus]
MALPAPNLDDRRFQDLVDDAKRLVMRRCPEWTDHNVSDPGVTLIETFAFMTDQLLFRLNRVPDRLYVKFLDLIGLRLLPPTPACAPVTFWLSAPASAPLTISTGTSAATVRSESTEAVVFSTLEELVVQPCSLLGVRTAPAGDDRTTDHAEPLRMGVPFQAFGAVPAPGDALYLGLTDPVPSCAVRIDFRGEVDGVGVDPTNPPLRWEAWDGQSWVRCDVSDDTTGGLNGNGTLVVHLPAAHAASVLDGERAGWLRARVLESEEGQPAYSSPPVVQALAACTVGGTVSAVHAEVVENELLGNSEGVAGQWFGVARSPLLAGAGSAVLEVSDEDGWQEWQQVEHFAASGPDDRHFLLDAVIGTVHFGPAVREPDGGLRQCGAIPATGETIRLRRYAIGGGVHGNVGSGAISTLKSSIPFVAGVSNREHAQGGVDGETLEQAKARASVLLRTRSRAVTAEDYESLAKEAAPEVARVRCMTAGEGDVTAGSVRVLVVPAAPQEDGRLRFEDLVPTEGLLGRITDRLDEVRLIGTRVAVEPPLYRGVTVVATVVARPRVDPDRVRRDALDALYRFLSPIGGGQRGTGWEFGRAVQAGAVFGVLQEVRGLELVEDVRLFGANPITGERGAQTARLELEPNSLVFSFGHQVRVERR